MLNAVIVGAHEGNEVDLYWTGHLITRANTNIYAFEPDIRAFQSLNKKRELYPRLIPLPFAVGLGDNQETLFHYPNGMSTTASPYFRPDQPDSFALVWTMRLDSFMMFYGLERIDFLIIDAPFQAEECLDSLAGYHEKVSRGWIRAYGDGDQITAWLGNRGFAVAVNDDVIHFWRG
jgi:FkbM family methyltransferase